MILLISDNLELSGRIQPALESRGLRLVREGQAGRALRDPLEGRYRAVLLDAGATGVEALEMVRRLRSRSSVPLIVLSALTDRTGLAAMFDSGADDYVGGPIDADEVVARIHAALRRGSRYRHLPGEVLELGGIRLMPASRRTQVDGETIELTSVEYDILEYLVREAGRIVPRDELTAAVCRREASPLDRSIDVHISHLRRKLKRHRTRIRTVRGIGYLLAIAEADPP